MHKEAALFEDDEWHGMLDHHPTRIDSKEERALVRRLDKRLLLFAMFGNLVKMLDNANLGSAFISGMEEELGIAGVQYNWMGVYFMLGYLFMQVPSNLLLARLRPSIYLPSLEMFWCFLTLAMATVQSVRGVFVIRVLLGLAEAGFYPGIIFLLGTWYTKKELGKRLALLTICGSLGGGMSGVVQAVMLKTMDGVWNISGWRWMFMVDACITALLFIGGFKYLPDYPNNTSWLSEAERQLAMRRLEVEGRESKRPTTRNLMACIRSLLTNRYLIPFIIGWAAVHVSLGATTVLGIVARKLGYDAVTANLITTVIMTWASEIISQNIEVRALAIGVMNTAACLTWTWTPLVLWPVTDAPYYHTGFRASVFSILIFIISMGVIGYRHSLDQPIPSSATMPMMQINTMTEEDDDDMNAAAKLLQARANAAQRTRR
ncbi:hypothetical protein DFQ30_009727 [Apophysomyces sp. BC1015]|nr:hypothetical protein DFQ30_009727 [Apophysomyces sp. BC1015]